MAFTYTNVTDPTSIGGRLRKTITDAVPDNSYAAAGEAFGGGNLNVAAAKIIGVEVIGQNAFARRFKWQYDSTNKKMVVSEPCPSLVVEEVVTVASNVGTLSKIPAYILGIEVTAGSVTGAFDVLPTGLTPTTTQVAVTFTSGLLTFLSTDAVTSVRVTYIPLGVGPFIEANRVVDEAVVFGSGAGDTFNLANRAALIQYVCNTTATAANRLPAMQPVGEAPGTNQIAVDFNNSGATTITLNAAQDTNTGKVTYWKYSAIGVAFGWTDQADITATSDAIVLPEVLDLGGLFIPGYGTKLVGEATATNKQQRIVGPSGTSAADVAVWNPAKGTITFAGADSITTCEVPYIVLQQSQFANEFAEVAPARDLSSASIRCEVTHY